MNEKERLDIFLHINGFAESREKAKQLIVNNCVYVDNDLISKPSAKISSKSTIVVQNEAIQYVGRGASKLEKH